MTRERHNDGFTLVEVLVALALLGGGMLVVMAALQLSSASAVHVRELAAAERDLRSFSEYIKDEPYRVDGNYGGGFVADEATPIVEQVACWNGTLDGGAPFGSCATDRGLQRLLLRVDTERSSLYLELVKRAD